jgi:cytoskeletal protein CcmA (bactofilin family)
MKKIASVLILLLGFSVFLSISQTAFAVEFAGGEELYIEDAILDDAYMGGGMITVESDVAGDLYLGGGTITINGNIDGDLVVGSGQIVVNGNVGDDLRAAGGSIFVNGNVGDDLIVTGGQFNLGSESLVGGSLILGTGYANILGTINEDIKGGGGKLVLGGTVYRDVQVEVGENLSLTKDARINGNLVYTSLVEGKFDETQVGGYIEFNKQKPEQDFNGNIENFFTRWYLLFELVHYASLLVIALVVVLIVPAGVLGINKITKTHPWKSLGLGFVVSVCSIAAIIISAVTVIGMPAAGILLGLFLISWCVAKVYAAYFIGSLLIKPKKTTKMKLFGITALGGFILMVIGIVPFIGWLIVLLAVMMAFGSLIWYKKDLYNKLGLQKLE